MDTSLKERVLEIFPQTKKLKAYMDIMEYLDSHPEKGDRTWSAISKNMKVGISDAGYYALLRKMNGEKRSYHKSEDRAVHYVTVWQRSVSKMSSESAEVLNAFLMSMKAVRKMRWQLYKIEPVGEEAVYEVRETTR